VIPSIVALKQNSSGIRVGYGAMPLWLMNYLWRVKQPYNVSTVAEVAACAALENHEYLKVRSSFEMIYNFFTAYRK
jgi:histidinol-phosphate/aromatic aminotransferase/cobyric acid decarboxylase-like protein